MDRQRIRAAIVSGGDVLARSSWSGTPRSIAQSLVSEFEIVYVERVGANKLWARLAALMSRAVGGRIAFEFHDRFLRLIFGGIKKNIIKSKPDIVFVVASSPLASYLIRYFRTILIHDSTARAIVEYYPRYAEKSPSWISGYQAVSERALNGAWLALYPSSWAASTAIELYGKAPADVHEIAWGHNMEFTPERVSRQYGNILKLLFVGLYWERKGGNTLIEAYKILRNEGYQISLDIVGVNGDVLLDIPNGVKFHGKLLKDDVRDADKLDQLFRSSQLLVVPSSAECYGIVFAEGAAYGLPSVSVRTGGVTSVINDGVTGVLIEDGSDANELASAIKQFTDPDRLRAMSENAYRDSIERLNWTVWASRVRKLVEGRFEAEGLEVHK